MSIKQSLRQAIEALPESVTLEEAFERLYTAFKMKQAQTQGQRMAAILEELAQSGGGRELSDAARWEREQRQDRSLPGRDP